MGDKTIQQIIDEMTEEQQTAVYAAIGAAMETAENDELDHSDFFENFDVLEESKKNGSLKDTIIEHAAEYGIENISELFPEAELLQKPFFIDNRIEWVNALLSGATKTPFARVKTIFADITKERARGYATKAKKKVEDVFTLMSRTSEPTTIYKKGKLDRDDFIDITDFNVVAWLKEEMRIKLNEEIARAILVGDGRSNADEYKIDETCIRPIYNDDDFFTIKATLGDEPNEYVAFINAIIRNRKHYNGSGNPILFTTEDILCEMLLLEDSIGNKLYKNVDDLKTTLRVSNIQTCNFIEGLTRDAGDSKTHNVFGIIVNPKDYKIGTRGNSNPSIFDDFDIDYNQQKYLIEQRLSGALTLPYSAIVVEQVVDPNAAAETIQNEV